MTEQKGSNHKTVESPWTHMKYVIRELDPAILSVFSKPETQEVKNVRIKIQDLLNDLESEKKRQEQKGEKDQSKLDAMQEQLNQYYEQIRLVSKLDEKEIENRRKIIQYGLVQPKIKNDDDFLDLGKDATFIYSNIVAMSEVPSDYADIIQGLFRQRQSASSKGDKSG